MPIAPSHMLEAHLICWGKQITLRSSRMITIWNLNLINTRSMRTARFEPFKQSRHGAKTFEIWIFFTSNTSSKLMKQFEKAEYMFHTRYETKRHSGFTRTYHKFVNSQHNISWTQHTAGCNQEFNQHQFSYSLTTRIPRDWNISVDWNFNHRASQQQENMHRADCFIAIWFNYQHTLNEWHGKAPQRQLYQNFLDRTHTFLQLLVSTRHLDGLSISKKETLRVLSHTQTNHTEHHHRDSCRLHFTQTVETLYTFSAGSSTAQPNTYGDPNKWLLTSPYQITPTIYTLPTYPCPQPTCPWPQHILELTWLV